MSRLNTNRIPWIDNVKFFAMWCVIFGHFNGLVFTHGRPGFAFVNLLIVVFNMPLFVFMSGYSNYTALQRLINFDAIKKYCIKSVERIALPCIIPCILVYFIQRDATGINFKHYWFLVMLFILQIACGIIFFIVKRFGIRKSMGWIVFVLSMIVLNKYASSEMCMYYLLGGMIKRLEIQGKNMFEIKRKKYILLPILCIAAIGLYFLVGKYQFYTNTIFTMFADHLLYLWFLRMVCACCFIYIIIYAIRRLSFRYNFISFLGSKTLGLYIWTGIIIDICQRYGILFNGETVFSWFSTVVVSIAATLLAMGVIRLLESNKLTEYLFFGKRRW